MRPGGGKTKNKQQGGKAMETNQIKAIIITIGSTLSSMLGILYIPVLLMVACNIIDYATGLMATPNRNCGISSYRSMKGIFKKVAMWLLVAVGVIIDQLLKYTTETIGITLPFTFLCACIVAVWITCNELISILENMVDIGISLPAFLLPLVRHIRSQVEDAAESVMESVTETSENVPGDRGNVLGDSENVIETRKKVPESEE